MACPVSSAPGGDKFTSLTNAVLRTVVDGIITIDDTARVQSFNPSAERIFGYAASEVVGRNVNMLMPEPYHSEHDRYVHDYLSTGRAQVIGIGREVTARRKDGTIFPMELGVSSFDLDGRSMFVGIIRDISERREGEAARELLRQAQKMESIGQLTGGIAHDFNNLLAIIIGNLEFLDEKLPVREPLRKYLTPSMEAAAKGAELTQRLLAFGRKQTLTPRIISVNHLITHFLTLLKRTLGERVEVMTNLSRDIWPVKADPGQLENVLLNLAVNARDAMPAGGRLVFETCNACLDADDAARNPDVLPGEYVMLAVSDNGTGMTPEVMEKAFDPFFTTKELGRGIGLGLSMVYGFVKQSAGHIRLCSELGQGTTARIYLPRCEGALHAPEREEAGPAPSSAAREAGCVLVVEDNRHVLEMTSAMVESLGYAVLTAPTGDAALRIIESRPDIDLLLTDVMLTGPINGPLLARMALQRRPGIKVLFNSGYAEQAIFRTGMLEEGVHLISKPFRRQKLAQKIAQLLL